VKDHKIKHNFHFISAVIFVAVLSPGVAKSQNVDQNAINQQDWITRNQQNKIEEDRRLIPKFIFKYTIHNSPHKHSRLQTKPHPKEISIP
jgi:hypothetical protein